MSFAAASTWLGGLLGVGVCLLLVGLILYINEPSDE